MPNARPLTTPDVLIEATAGVPLLHVPPVVESVNVTVEPTQIVSVPKIIAAGLKTVMRKVLLEVPHAFVTA